MGNALEKSLGYARDDDPKPPKVPLDPRWEQAWLKVVVPGCKAHRFRGCKDHPRIDRELDYSLDYFLVGLMLDRWPKPLPPSWIKALDALDTTAATVATAATALDATAALDAIVAKQKSLRASHAKPTQARKPSAFQKKIMDAYYEKRPSKAWLRANTAYIESLSEQDKNFLKAWGMTFFRFVNGKALTPGTLSIHASTLLSFITQVRAMNKNGKMMKRLQDYMENHTLWEEQAKTYKALWESYGSDKPLDFETAQTKHFDDAKALSDWVNSHAKALREVMMNRMKVLTAKAPALDREIIVYRGISKARAKDSNMRSFSLDYSVARGFGSSFGMTGTALPYLLRLTLPKGSKMLFVPSTAPVADEMEAIIDMGRINPKSWTQKWPIYLPSSFQRCAASLEPKPSRVIVFQGATLK